MTASNGQQHLRIALDGTPLMGRRTGIGHVAAELLKALVARGDSDLVVYAITRRGRARLAGLLPPGVRPGTSPVPARFALPLWERFAFPRIEHWTGPVDVVHATNFLTPPGRAPVVVTVHDLTFMHRPDLVSEETRRFVETSLRRGIERGASIHVVSDFVGQEVREAFGLPPERVVRVYPGIAVTGGGDPLTGRALVGSDTYVLALGQLEPRKNLPTLVRAFDRISSKHPNLRLVIAGPDGWGRAEFEAAVHQAKHGERVRWLGYVADAERRDLLAGATVFAYPSLYEGFGHPPLEAMAAGIPVVTTTAGAVPEITAGAALLADPHDVEGLSEQLSRALSDEDLRAELVQRGGCRADEFLWRNAVDGFLQMYERVAATPQDI